MLAALLAATLAAVPTVRVQQRTWGVEEGLPQSSVTAIAQGPEGLLYLGTFSGLARFDGRHIDTWNPALEQAWSSIRVTALAVGDDGTQWIGLQDGSIERADARGSMSPSPLAGGVVWELATDGEGVWAAGDVGAAYWDGSWHLVEATANARAVVVSAPGTPDRVAWLAGDDWLARCAGADPQCDVVRDGQVPDIRDLALDGDTLLVAGTEGWGRWSSAGYDRVSTRPVDQIAVGGDGIWLADRHELTSADGRVHVELPGHPRALIVGREEGIWVGTDNHGLVRITKEDWTLIPIDEGVLPVLEQPDGSVLAGAGCGDPGLIELGDFGLQRLPFDGCVRALASGGRDGAWIGADSSVWRLTDGGSVEEIADVGHPVLVLLRVGDELWIGTDAGGAFVLRDGAPEPVDVGDDRVLAIAQGDNGTLWFGTHGGLSYRAPDGTIQRWTVDDGTPPGAIRALHVDGDGTLLMGTYGGGLGVLRDGKLSRLTVADGLRDAVVSTILDDGRGDLWLGGNRGLSRLMRSELEAWLADPSDPVHVRRWASPEGNGGGQPAGIVRRDGTLLLPTVEGLLSLDPTHVFRNPVVPQVTVLSADVDGQPLVPGGVVDIEPGPGRVFIEFTAATLRHPELAQLEYRVRGPDDGPEDGWKRSGEDRRAIWAGFEPGRHVIELRAANEDGVFSAPVELTFVLAPAWNERGSVWASLALLAAMIGFGAHHWRTRQTRRHNTALRVEIDQRTIAEDALRRSEAHYRRVFEGGSDALMITGRDGTIEHANAAADELAGRSVVGARLDDVFGARDPDSHARRVKREDERWAAVVEMAFDPGRNLVRAADVTARLHADRAQRELSQRLARAERLEAVGRLAGGIAHDFNNLLTAVLGTAHLLRKPLRRAALTEEEELVDGLESCVERGAKLTRELLAFARRQRLEPEHIDPAVLIGDLEQILRSSLRGDIELHLQLPASRLGLRADAAQLELSLVNLVLNAQDAMPDGGRIVLSVRELDSDQAEQLWPEAPPERARWVGLTVSDNGEGIPSDKLAKVLEPFYTTRPTGSGLGLPSVHGFASQSGGALHLASTPGVGTEVTLLLPWEEPPTVRLTRVHRAQVERIGHRGRVVLVDDDDTVRRVLAKMLEHAGYETVPYDQPEKLLADFDEDFACDLLVSDILMPGISGPRLVEQLLQRRPSLPVVFVSGFTRDTRELPGPLLRKPISSRDLLDAVANALGTVDESTQETERPRAPGRLGPR